MLYMTVWAIKHRTFVNNFAYETAEINTEVKHLLLGVFIRFVPEYALWIYSLYFIPFIFITPVLCIFLADLFEKISAVDRLLAHVGFISLELYMCHVFCINQLDSLW